MKLLSACSWFLETAELIRALEQGTIDKTVGMVTVQVQQQAAELVQEEAW